MHSSCTTSYHLFLRAASQQRVLDTATWFMQGYLSKGNYLTSSDTLVDPPTALLAYFPSAELPVEPGARFAELFLARPRWKVEEIAPFLADVAVDTKERDKLLLKHARAVTEADGIWYTARAKYSA